MKLIEEYLDKLYKKDNNKYIVELKQEMRDHLMDSVNEFKLDGLNEEEACKKAIKRFDDGIEMQNELHNIINELSSSLDKHKSLIKVIKVVLVCISIISFLISGLMWYSNYNEQRSKDNLAKEFEGEIRKLAQKYDMTNVDEYKVELEKIMSKDKYSQIEALRIYVADMEYGNTSLSSLGVQAKTVYEKEADYDNIGTYSELLGYNGKDFLDKSGNIVNPDIFLEYSFYYDSQIVVFAIGMISIISYFMIRSKVS